MCKNVVLVPLKAVDPAMQKKSCKPEMLGRVWQATRRALSLQHSPSHQFACCQWQKGQRPPASYLIYRWILFITVMSIGVTSFACQHLPRHYEGPKVELNYFKWFIYFTNWGFMLIALQTGLALAVVHRYRIEKSFDMPYDEEETGTPDKPRTPLLCRAYWLAHTVATDLAFVITLIYWTLVHDPKLHEVNATNLLVHGGNSLIMLCELAMTAHPLRAAHALYGASAGLAYGVFSALYWALGGTDRLDLPAIYPALNWNKPGSALGFVALCAVVMICAHALATCLTALRMHIARRVRPPRANADCVALPTY